MPIYTLGCPKRRPTATRPRHLIWRCGAPYSTGRLAGHPGLLDTIKGPNPLRHPGPRIFIVRIGNYAYIENYAWRVPFETTETGLFLRTAYPSRESTRDYLR